jgi:predicted HTH domain antitoxin
LVPIIHSGGVAPWRSRLARTTIPEGEIAGRLRTELAIALYAQGALSLGKAAELAEMNRMNFGEMVGERGIARHYGDAELAQDLSYARSE